MQLEPSLSPPEPSLQLSRHRSPSVASSSFSPSPTNRDSRSKSTTRRFLLPRGRRTSSTSSKSPGPSAGRRLGGDAESTGSGLAADDEEKRGRSRGRRRVGGTGKGKERVRAAAVEAFGNSVQQRRYDWFMGRLHPVIRHFLGWREHEGVATGGGKPYLPLLSHVSPQVESYLLAFVASLVGISSLLLLFDKTEFLQLRPEGDEKVLVIGSMGAAVVLLYSLPLAPPSQPRPLVLGQVVSSVIGCSVSRLFSLAGPARYSLYFSSQYDNGGTVVWIAGALATSLSLAAMKATSSVHPPGGATALLSCTSKSVAKLGFALVPIVLISSSILLLVALLLVNLTRLRYPVYWWIPSLPNPHTLPSTSAQPPPSNSLEPTTKSRSIYPIQLSSRSSSRRPTLSPGGRSSSQDQIESTRTEDLEELHGGGDWLDEEMEGRGDRATVGITSGLAEIQEGEELEVVRGRTRTVLREI